MKQVFLLLSTLLTVTANAQQSNFHFSHTESTAVGGDKIGQIWTDVPNWKQWDKGLKKAIIEGGFRVGTKGKLIPNKGPKSTFVISEIVPNKSYTFKTKIPLGWLIIKRTLETKEGITHFSHDVKFTGILKKIIGNKLGRNYKAMLPSVLAEIKLIAERK